MPEPRPLPARLSTWQLANLAECVGPDRPDGIGLEPPPANPDPSPGVTFLRAVETATREAVEYAGEDFDPDDFDAHEIADGAVPIYTFERWATFLDLAAWQEDPAELVADGDMTDRAGVCLYMIAERLALALAADIAAEWETDDDEGGE